MFHECVCVSECVHVWFCAYTYMGVLCVRTCDHTRTCVPLSVYLCGYRVDRVPLQRNCKCVSGSVYLSERGSLGAWMLVRAPLAHTC